MSEASPSTSDGAPDWWRWAVALPIVGLLAYMGVGTYADPDLWGHIRFGQLHLETGGLIRQDPFAFVPTRVPWINHEWLSEVWFAMLYDLAGAWALIGFKLIGTLALFALVVATLRREDLDLIRSALLAVPFFFSVLIRLTVVRPHLFTLLAFAVLLLCLRAAERGRSRWLLALPVLFAAWVNFHGGFLAGLGVLGIWSLARLGTGLARWKREGLAALRPWAVSAGVLALAAAATLINPYGFELPAFLVETATVQRPYISEWQPLQIRSVVGAVYLLQLALVVGGLIVSDREFEPALVVPLAVITLLPLTAVRHVALFGLAAPLLAGEHLAALFRRAPDSSAEIRPWVRGALAVLMVPVAGLLLWKSIPRLGCLELRPNSYPVRAVQWLDASDAEPRLATFFNWGEYVIWHLGPETKVSMDGRRETVYPDSVYREYLSFIRGRDDWSSYLEKYGANAALVEVGQPPDNLLKLKPGWSEAYRDSLAVIHAREGSALLERSGLAVPDSVSVSGAGTCFP